MNEYTEAVQELITLLNSTGLKLEASSDEIRSAVETLCHKLITWQIVTAVMFILLFTALLALSIAAIKSKTMYKKLSAWTNHEDAFWRELLISLGIALAIGSVVGILMGVYNLTMCFVFPEKVILSLIGGC